MMRSRASCRMPNKLRAAVSILNTAAWEAAGVSQAVAHMPLAEAQALTKVYSSTRTFNALEEQVEERWLEFSGVPSRLQGTDRSRVESGIEQLKILLGYQMAITASAPQLVQECDDALRMLSAR